MERNAEELLFPTEKQSWWHVPGIVLSAVHALFHLILPTSQWGKNYYYSHVVEEKTEAQGG